MFERNYPTFGKKTQNGVAKIAFHVSRATLWGKNDENKLYEYLLFWDFGWVFCSVRQKKLSGCRNINLNVQRENVRKNTFEQLFFHYFWTLTRKTWILPENFGQKCHNYILLLEGDSWRAKLLKGSLEILKFFEFLLMFLGQWGKSISGLLKLQQMSRWTI